MEILIAAAQSETRDRLAQIVAPLGMSCCASNWAQITGLMLRGFAVALVDADLLPDGVFASIRHLHAVCPATRIVLLHETRDERLQLDALAAGAVGCLRPSIDDSTIRRAVTLVHGGEAWIERHLVPKLIQRLTAGSQTPSQDPAPAVNASRGFASTGELTGREKDVLRLLSMGSSNKRIANELQITERTVKAHLTSVYKKLGVSDRVQLILQLSEVSDTKITDKGQAQTLD